MSYPSVKKHDTFSLIRSSQFSFLEIIRHVFVNPYRENPIIIICVWFKSIALCTTMVIFKFADKSRIDLATGLVFHAYFIFDFDYLILVVVSVDAMTILCLELL